MHSTSKFAHLITSFFLKKVQGKLEINSYTLVHNGKALDLAF